MNRTAQIQAELQELGVQHLLNAPSTMPFAVPNNYFSETITIMQAVASGNENELLRSANSKAMPFAAPDAAYFEGLADNILNKINEEPLLALPKENPFAVPTGYFEQLPEAVLAKVKLSETAIFIPKRVPVFRYVQMAAALAMIIFVGLASFRSQDVTPIVQNELSSISKSEIATYVNNNLDEFDTDMILNTLAKNDNKIIGSNDLTEEEIRNYLNENGWN